MKNASFRALLLCGALLGLGALLGPSPAQAACVSDGGTACNYSVTPTASDNHASIKSGAGLFLGAQVFNDSATVNFIRLYDLGAGFNGCGSATGIIWRGEIPANTSVAGFVFQVPRIIFSNGLGICITGAIGDTDTTSATAAAINVNINFQ